MYETTAGVEEYAAMARGYDGRSHIEILKQMLAEGAGVLELGMGPGVDLDMLAQKFEVLGSDSSQAFLDRYSRTRPEVQVLRLDAVTIDTDSKFDAVYSNKVLHHLTREEMRRSLKRQAEILRSGGILLHGLWAGTETEKHQGLICQRYTPDTFKALVPPSLEIIRCETYKEMSEDDSLRVILRLKQEKK